jgi:hypothetical protein
MNGKDETLTPGETTRQAPVARAFPYGRYRGGTGGLPLITIAVALVVSLAPTYLRHNARYSHGAARVSRDACMGAPVVPELPNRLGNKVGPRAV